MGRGGEQSSDLKKKISSDFSTSISPLPPRFISPQSLPRLGPSSHLSLSFVVLLPLTPISPPTFSLGPFPCCSSCIASSLGSVDDSESSSPGKKGNFVICLDNYI